jgi:hypothetical protein
MMHTLRKDKSNPHQRRDKQPQSSNLLPSTSTLMDSKMNTKKLPLSATSLPSLKTTFLTLTWDKTLGRLSKRKSSRRPQQIPLISTLTPQHKLQRWETYSHSEGKPNSNPNQLSTSTLMALPKPSNLNPFSMKCPRPPSRNLSKTLWIYLTLGRPSPSHRLTTS